MGSVLNLLTRIQQLDTDKVIDDSIDQTLEALADINRERMNDGVRSDGSKMPDYSYVSVHVYGYPPGPIKLLATGAFQAGIVVKRDGVDYLNTYSTDSKDEMLVEKYGETIFGIGGDYKKQYIDENLRPAFNKEIKLATGLN